MSDGNLEYAGDMLEQAFYSLAAASIQGIKRKDGDYINSDGLLTCGVCGTPREYIMSDPWQGGKIKVGIPCKCEREKQQAEDEARAKRARMIEIERLRDEGITDTKYMRHTFEADDRRVQAITDACRKYADEWAENKQHNRGILFYGSKGTGKTFYACCIANALIDRGISARVETFPRIIDAMQSTYDKTGYIERLVSPDLLVLDDLAAESDSAYRLEVVYNVVDSRLRKEKPVIITTNTTLDTLKRERDIRFGRIYDRVLEMCPVRIEMTGDSRRSGRYI